jgi:hypothetical protein
VSSSSVNVMPSVNATPPPPYEVMNVPATGG